MNEENETSQRDDVGGFDAVVMTSKHSRFNRKVWAFKDDFTGAIAKWLVKLSPYTVPDNLSICIEKFELQLSNAFSFNDHEMVEIDLNTLTETVNELIENVPEIVALNERKNGREGMGFSDRYSVKPEPDDDFIDLMALAQNITCEFADRADADCYLESNRAGKAVEPLAMGQRTSSG